MRKRFYGALLALGTAGAVVAVTPGAAFAGQSTSTANLSAVLAGQAIGSRTIALVTPGSFSSVLGNANMTSPLVTEIAETSVSGDANWSVTGGVTQFSDGAPTPHTIAANALNNSANNTVQALGGGTVTEGSGTGDLGAGQTFFTNSGQDTSTLYTGTYSDTSTLTLTPPNGTFAAAAGTTYTATLTVTLFT
jgi:hypothetical protein